MIKTAVLIADLKQAVYPTENRAALAFHLAALLHTHGADITLINVRVNNADDAPFSVPTWAAHLPIRDVTIPPAPAKIYPQVPLYHESAHLLSLLREYALVYALDPFALIFDLVRAKRSMGAHLPIIVALLTGGLAWSMLHERRFPSDHGDIIALYMEQTAVQGADFTTALSPLIPTFLQQQRGWRWRDPVRVLGVPFVLLSPRNAPPHAPTAQPITRLIVFGQPHAAGSYVLLRALDYLHQNEPVLVQQLERVTFVVPEAITAETRRWQRDLMHQLAYGYHLDFIHTANWEAACDVLQHHSANALLVTASPDVSYHAMLAAQLTNMRVLSLADVQNDAADRTASEIVLAEALARALQTGVVPLPYDHDAANARWIQFHGEVAAKAEQGRASASPPLPDAKTNPAIDVCVPYFNQPRYLPQLLQSLEQQTFTSFRVIVIDDGSTDPEARAVFDAMRDRYMSHGWIFVRQPNRYPGAARNHAVRLGSAEALLFVDADDIAPPNLLERLWEALHHTGDDIVVAASYRFVNHASPLDAAGKLTTPPGLLYMPVGNDLVGSMIDDVHGGPTAIIRRRVFESLGGYTEIPGIGFEDYELYVRAGLAGYRVSALHEPLHLYRALDGGVSTHTNLFRNHERVIRHYESHLRQVKLNGLTPALKTVEIARENLANSLKKLEQESEQAWNTRFKRRGVRGGKSIRILFIAPFFPYPAMSGSVIRNWTALEYFGRRHDVTLVTFSPYPAVLSLPTAVKRVITSAVTTNYIVRNQLTQDERFPRAITHRVTSDISAILELLPTERFDVAWFAQIFVDGYQPFVKTPYCLLDEHNIESDIFRQYANTATTAESNDTADHLKQAALMRDYETRVWGSYDMVTTVSEHDRAEILQRGVRTAANTLVVENGTAFLREPMRARAGSKTLLFVGTMNYQPNMDAAEYFIDHILPLLHQHDPDIRVIIAGRNPPASVLAMSERPGVRVIDSPKEIPPLAAESSVSIVPLRMGSGTRLKVLDSMALGLPCVSTTLGCAGLDCVDGEHLLIRDDPHAFADGVLHLLKDRALWRKLRDNGRRFVEQNHSWSALWSGLEQRLLQDLR